MGLTGNEGKISMMCLVDSNTVGREKSIFFGRQRLKSLDTHMCSFRCFGGSTAADECSQKSVILSNFWASDRNFRKKRHLAHSEGGRVS